MVRSNVLPYSLSGALCVALAAAQQLTKPPLHPNLDYLNAGLTNNLKPTANTQTFLGTNIMPRDCYQMTTDAKLSPFDISAYSVKYSDCGDAWLVCIHKNSPVSLATMIDRFGRLPVQTRDFVRHIISLPDSGDHAYNSGGNIAMFNTAADRMTVWIHESGHSLDLLNAYTDKPLSNSQKWNSEYAQDSYVPDPYSQTNAVEDVAQNTVCASFDVNVPGGLRGVDPNNYMGTFHQWATVETEGRNNQNRLVPGGSCTSRLQNSDLVKVVPAKRSLVALDHSDHIKISEAMPKIAPVDFHTGETCFKSH